MKRKLFLFSAICICFVLCFSVTAFADEYTFSVAGKELKFLAICPGNTFGNNLTLPNGKTEFMMNGSWAAHAVDIIQTEDKSIFMVAASNVGSWVAIFNGESFFTFLEGNYMVNEPIFKSENNSLVAYSLIPEGGDDVFEGLLIFKNGYWKFHQYKGEKRNSAKEIKMVGNELQITHNAWNEEENKNHRFTYFSFSGFDSNFFQYAEGHDPNFQKKSVEPKKAATLDGKKYKLDSGVYSAAMVGAEIIIRDSTGKFLKGGMIYVFDSKDQCIAGITMSQFLAAPSDDSSAKKYVLQVVAGTVPKGEGIYVQKVLE